MREVTEQGAKGKERGAQGSGRRAWSKEKVDPNKETPGNTPSLKPPKRKKQVDTI